jgi:hypothetical protein
MDVDVSMSASNPGSSFERDPDGDRDAAERSTRRRADHTGDAGVRP